MPVGVFLGLGFHNLRVLCAKRTDILAYFAPIIKDSREVSDRDRPASNHGFRVSFHNSRVLYSELTRSNFVACFPPKTTDQRLLTVRGMAQSASPGGTTKTVTPVPHARSAPLAQSQPTRGRLPAMRAR